MPLVAAGRGAHNSRGGHLPDVYARTLQRAMEICGGEVELALRLDATPSHVALWLRGVETPPTHIFLRAVDLLSEEKPSADA
jgi:hypothetical protein